jgi:hypothetical protein
VPPFSMATSMQLVDTLPTLALFLGVEWWHPGSKIRSWEEVASFNHARRAFEVFRIDNRVNVFGGISESNDIDVHVTSCEMCCPPSQQ